MYNRATRFMTVRSLTFCELYSLTRSDLFDLMRTYPKQFVQLVRTARKRMVAMVRSKMWRGIRAMFIINVLYRAVRGSAASSPT